MQVIHVDYLGEKNPAVFFVHGFSDYMREYQYQKPYFAGDCRVASFDFMLRERPEMPESGGCRVERFVERFAEDLKAVVDEFEPHRFVITGYGTGESIVCEFYERFGGEYAGRLKGLAIISVGVESTGAGSLAKLISHWRKKVLDRDIGKGRYETFTADAVFLKLHEFMNTLHGDSPVVEG